MTVFEVKTHYLKSRELEVGTWLRSCANTLLQPGNGIALPFKVNVRGWLILLKKSKFQTGRHQAWPSLQNLFTTLGGFWVLR